MITAEQLQDRLDYDPQTGEFTWIKSMGRVDRTGRVAGTVAHNGYIHIGIKTDGKKKLYLGHRLAFLWMTGKWPPNEVDHINGERSDNRWCNLRLATRRQNCCNKAVRKNNKAGITGVWFDTANQKWACSVDHRWGGRFHCLAQAARKASQLTRDQFGEFARDS